MLFLLSFVYTKVIKSFEMYYVTKPTKNLNYVKYFHEKYDLSCVFLMINLMFDSSQDLLYLKYIAVVIKTFLPKKNKKC